MKQWLYTAQWSPRDPAECKFICSEAKLELEQCVRVTVAKSALPIVFKEEKLARKDNIVFAYSDDGGSRTMMEEKVLAWSSGNRGGEKEGDVTRLPVEGNTKVHTQGLNIKAPV
ncbi:hypothetical protein QTP70_001217, partial [Hemibagrus guttatus]